MCLLLALVLLHALSLERIAFIVIHWTHRVHGIRLNSKVHKYVYIAHKSGNLTQGTHQSGVDICSKSLT